MSGKPGYAAASDPPAGARPARDTGVSSVAVGQIARLTRERDEARADAIRARVARDEARQERDAARQERDEAVRSQEFAEAEEAVMFRKAAALQRERDEARAALEATRETLTLMNRAFLEMQRQRNEVEAALGEARAAARDYLLPVKFSYDDRAERERLPWLGPPETPLEECEP